MTRTKNFYLYVLIVIMASASLLLLWRSSSTPAGASGLLNRNRRLLPGAHRRIKLRSSLHISSSAVSDPAHDHEAVAFDPLIAEMERRREDREWERHLIQDQQRNEGKGDGAVDLEHAPGMEAQPNPETEPEWEDFMNAEDYVNDEERFNVTYRLLLLFPKVDVDPPDGRLSVAELTQWHLQQSLAEVVHRSEREMELYDHNQDGRLAFAEYKPPAWVRDSGNITAAYGIVNGWWQEEHFNASDDDGDGLLNITEFNNFLHPADSKSPRLIEWLCQEEVRERDSDKDGKLSFLEFYHGLYDQIRNYHEGTYNYSHLTLPNDPEKEAAGKKLFTNLDKNNDGYLTYDELQPVIDKLHPGEEYYAKQQADYIIMQADDDKDGQLSLKEMIDHPYVFYSSIFSDEDEDEDYHDEFR